MSLISKAETAKDSAAILGLEAKLWMTADCDLDGMTMIIGPKNRSEATTVSQSLPVGRERQGNFFEGHDGTVGVLSIYWSGVNVSKRCLAIMHLAIRSIRADLRNEYADNFRNVQNPDLSTSMFFNDSNWSPARGHAKSPYLRQNHGDRWQPHSLWINLI